VSFDIVRAWKDDEYRESLSDEERCSLPSNPVGEIELTDADLELVYGGWKDHKRGNSNNCHNNSDHCSGICVSFQCNSFVCSVAIVC
jgi:mersacidin/lichenicidin family type 2 lantibiotic